MEVLDKNKEVIKDDGQTFKPVETYEIKKHHDILVIFGILIFIFLIILLICFAIFSIINSNNPNIINGVYIKGIDVSNLSKEEAKQKIKDYINSSIPEEITLKHENYETNISLTDYSVFFNVDEAVEIASNIGKEGSIFKRDFTILETLFYNINIEPNFSINEEQLKNTLDDISTKLNDKVIESSYYIDGNDLIITNGKEGCVVNSKETATQIINIIKNLNFNNLENNSIELVTYTASPKAIDIESIYNEIHKEPVDAYYTQNPYMVVPSENGLDFSISLDEAKNLLNEQKDEYIIPLKVLYPNVTTNMIGNEAFPDLLSEFSTKYAASNRNRTTNLILAANKINGTVLMPGETFSYNKVVGERTIAAGYKEAPIYVDGRVEDGLGGGICQITSTLYNAVLYANLEIVERSNHQFVPSYVNASRDATVVYGAIDFKFKNNRNYPIKINCTVENGIANFKIYGLRTADDYEVEISSKIIRTTSTSIYSEAYKTLRKNGTVVSSKVISRDTYKRGN